MMPTTHSAWRAIAVVAAIVLTGPAAAAQPPPAETEKPPIQIGAFELWPTVVVRAVADPNVFNEAENAKSDFTVVAVPGLEVVIRPPRLRLSYTTGTDFVYFHKQKGERSVNLTHTLRAEADLTHFHPFVAVSAATGRARPNSEIDLRARSIARAYSAGVRANLGPVSSMTFGARRGTTTFDPGQEFRGVDLATELNNETTAFEGTFRLALTPLTSVSLVVAKEDDRFVHSPLRNFDSLRIAPTIAFQPSGLFNGSASVGWRRFDAANPAVEDYSGLAASGTIGLTLRERFHIETRFGRDIRTSYDPRTPTYLWTSAAGTLRTDIARRIDVRLTVGREVMSYKPLAGIPTAPRDRVLMYGGGLGYNVTKKVRIGVDAEHIERKADEKSRGYTSDRLLGNVVWGIK